MTEMMCMGCRAGLADMMLGVMGLARDRRGVACSHGVWKAVA